MTSQTIVACVVAILITAVVTWLLSSVYRKQVYEKKIGSAEDKAKTIIDDALKSAESKKRDILLTAKEEALKTKNDIEKEVADRRSEIQHMEKRVLQREENLDKKSDTLERREQSLSAKESNLAKRQAEVEELSAKRQQELERISGMSSEEAKHLLIFLQFYQDIRCRVQHKKEFLNCCGHSKYYLQQPVQLHRRNRRKQPFPLSSPVPYCSPVFPE